MIGILISIIAGAAMSFQGVFNTRVSEKVGVWETTAIVQGIAFLLTLIISISCGDGCLKNLKDVNKIYLLGGALGVVITFTVIKGIKLLGPTYSISTILISQLTIAALIDAFGLFGCNQIRFTISKILGLVIMIAGIVIFKLK